MENNLINREYKNWLSQLKSQFRDTQLKAVVTVNSALLEFYWQLATEITEKQKSSIWGDGFLKQLSQDLIAEFPDVKGFSLNNLQYIKRWYLFYIDDSNCGTACSTISQQASSQLFLIPWGHNLKIISKSQSIEEALFYVKNTIKYGWSRAVLTHQIDSKLWQRKGKAISNFSKTLPATQSDLAQQTLKDPYVFDFLNLTNEYNERALEQGLVQHITQFLLELGAGFAYIGKQVPLQVGKRNFFLDLLFYHTQLHCYVVIELKTTDFEPEHAGKLNFYIKAVDEQLRKKGDQPTIGILLCKEKDKLVAEYALSDINKPIGVSEYQLTQSLPENLKSSLPSIDQIEAELFGDLENSNET
ncbi:MAG: DUF1016 family protein [Colwellia sp.]|nr:DUF1016 family protein [Colwellia sp.]